jgi:hypothetical protein
MSESFRPQRRRVARILSVTEGEGPSATVGSSASLDASFFRSESVNPPALLVPSAAASAIDHSAEPQPPSLLRHPTVEEDGGGMSLRATTGDGSVVFDPEVAAEEARKLEEEEERQRGGGGRAPEHKRVFKHLYNDAAVLGEPLLSDIARLWAKQFGGGVLLTPIEQWGLDDDAEALASGAGLGGRLKQSAGGSFRFSRERSTVGEHANTYSVLTRLAGTRDATEAVAGGAAPSLFNDEHKLTFDAEGATTSGQRLGEDAPPTVLLTVTAQPVRNVGGMLLIDGFFAFHNAPFLDKRNPPGRIRIPLPTLASIQQNASSSAPTSPTASSAGSAAAAALIDIVRAGRDWQRAVELARNRSSVAPSSSGGAGAEQDDPAAASASGNSVHAVAPRRPSHHAHAHAHGGKEPDAYAVCILHEYCGAAAPADDWVIQTFQLIDPAVGLAVGPTLVRGYKTAAAIQRRERRIAAARQGELLSRYGAAYGNGERRQSQFGANPLVARRQSVLMDKYGEGAVASFRSGRRQSRAGDSGAATGGGGGGAAPAAATASAAQDAEAAAAAATAALAAAGVTVLRQLLPEEEVLRLRSPAVFALFAQQDLFELVAAATVIRRAVMQYRSSHIVRRNLRRVFTSLAVLQRFTRTLSRRRSSAMQRVLRDWAQLEAAFVARLRRSKPVDGDVVDAVVTRVLIDGAITPEPEKRRRVEDAWRASRWEIAVAWRISTVSGGNSSNNGGSAASAASSASSSPEFEAWAARREKRKVFSYFISAVPLFEAAQRRLAVRCGFGKRSVFSDAEMQAVLRRSGVSLTQMSNRRAVVFAHEVSVARATEQEERAAEQAMLNAELSRRVAAAAAASGAAAESMRRPGLLLQSTTQGGLRSQRSASANTAPLPPRPAGTEMGTDAAAILEVLREGSIQGDDLMRAIQRGQLDVAGLMAEDEAFLASLRAIRASDSHRIRRSQRDKPSALSLGLGVSQQQTQQQQQQRQLEDSTASPFAHIAPQSQQKQQQQRNSSSMSPRSRAGRSSSVAHLEEREKSVLRRGIPLPWLQAKP